MSGIRHLISKFETEESIEKDRKEQKGGREQKSRREDEASRSKRSSTVLQRSSSSKKSGAAPKTGEKRTIDVGSTKSDRSHRTGEGGPADDPDKLGLSSLSLGREEESSDMFIGSLAQDDCPPRSARRRSEIARKPANTVTKHRKAVSTIVEVDNELVTLCQPSHDFRGAEYRSKQRSTSEMVPQHATEWSYVPIPNKHTDGGDKKSQSTGLDSEVGSESPTRKSSGSSAELSLVSKGTRSDEDTRVASDKAEGSLPTRSSKDRYSSLDVSRETSVKGLNITLNDDNENRLNRHSTHDSSTSNGGGEPLMTAIRRSLDHVYSGVPVHGDPSKDVCNSSLVSVGSDAMEDINQENQLVSKFGSYKSSGFIDEAEEDSHTFYGIRLSDDAASQRKTSRGSVSRSSITRHSIVTSTDSNVFLPSPASKSDLFDTTEKASTPVTPMEISRLPFSDQRKARPVSAITTMEVDNRRTRTNSTNLQPSIHFRRTSKHPPSRLTPTENEGGDYFYSDFSKPFGNPNMHSFNVVSNLEDTIGPDPSTEGSHERKTGWKRAIGKLFGRNTERKSHQPKKSTIMEESPAYPQTPKPRDETPRSPTSLVSRARSLSKRPVSFVSSAGSPSNDNRRISVERVHDFRTNRTPESPSVGKMDFIPSRAAPTPRPQSSYTPNVSSLSRSPSVRKSKNSSIPGLQLHPSPMIDNTERPHASPISESSPRRTGSVGKRFSYTKGSRLLFAKDRTIDRRSISGPMSHNELKS